MTFGERWSLKSNPRSRIGDASRRFVSRVMLFTLMTVALLGRPPSGSAEVKKQKRTVGHVRVEVRGNSDWHVYPLGKRFEVALVRSGGGNSPVWASWVDADGRTLGKRVALEEGVPKAVRSPSGAPGYYGLVFSSEDKRVGFPPQPAGFPSAEHGFAVLPPPPTAEDGLMNRVESPFGIVHAHVTVDGHFDPYLRGHHIKTLTWQTLGPSEWPQAIRDRAKAGLIELPLLVGRDWDSDGTKPIEEAELRQLEKRFTSLARSAPIRDWELGVEENLQNRFEREPYYLANLAKKVRRVRRGLLASRADGRLVYNLEGFNYGDWERLAESDVFRWLDVLSTHPYRWPKFESPELWLGRHIERLKSILARHGRPSLPLWVTEIGAPVRGNNDPSGFFGYPEQGHKLNGIRRSYAAGYLVKYHAIALGAGVQRVYVYNYQNAGNDPRQAEDHFGLRGFAENGGPGAPLPGYVAYVTMLLQLRGKSLIRRARPRRGVWLYEFRGGRQRTVLAWRGERDGPSRLGLSDLVGRKAGTNATASDLYGRPISVEPKGILVGTQPIYITVED